MIYDAQTEAKLREKACVIALEIVNRGNLLAYLRQHLHYSALQTIATSQPNERDKREEAYFMAKAADVLIGHLENLASEARQARKKE